MLTLVDENACLKERVRELEMIISFSGVLGLRRYFTDSQCTIIGLLLRHEIVSRDMLYSSLYNGRADTDLPEEKTLDVRLSHLRIRLRAQAITLHNRFGAGWYLNAPDKDKLRELCA